MTSSRWPLSERPRERLFEAGPQALSDGELLAILLGPGTRGRSAAELARGLLVDWGGLTGLLGSTPAELARANGLGPARVARLAASLELGLRTFDASVAGLPSTANVDAIEFTDATHLYLSFSTADVTVPGLGSVQDEDVIHYETGTWSLYFDGTSRGLGGNADLDVDSIDVP